MHSAFPPSSRSTHTDQLHPTARKGFDSQVDSYETNRPGYAPHAVQWLLKTADLLKPGKNVIEIGSGTGKFTKEFLRFSSSCHLSAVEPVKGMREKLKETLSTCQPGHQVEIVDAIASDLPVKSGSTDAIICAQAFHWFANAETLKEFYRVLTPITGKLALIWNLEDGETRWVHRLRELYQSYEEGAPQYHRMEWKKVFSETDYFKDKEEYQYKTFTPNVNRDAVWGRILSKSYIAKRTPEEQSVIKEKVLNILAEEIPETVDNPDHRFDFPHSVDVVVYTRQ